MIRAITPTSSTVLMMPDIRVMLRADTMTLTTYSRMTATKMFIAEEPRSQRNSRKMMAATIRMSRMSVSEILRKPSKARGMSVSFSLQI